MSKVVYCVRCRRRGCYVLRWQDDDGRWRQRQAGRKRREAEAARRDLEQQLATRPAEQIDWPELWTRYIAEGLAGRRPATLNHAWSVKAALDPGRPPGDLDAAWASQAVAGLQRRYAAATAASYAKRLRACLIWAARVGYARQIRVPVPEAPQPRGRPLQLEEFERMQLAARRLYPARLAADLVRVMRGLWASGLRLGELMDLTWDDPASWHVCYLGHATRRPCLVIPAGRQKSGRHEVIPAAPDFVSLLLETPPADRRGRVFEAGARSMIGKRIAACGRRAKLANGRGRHATAHDLRRSFAMRWAEAGLAEAELAAILRHRSTQTTRQYYELIDAERLADRLYTLSRAEGDRCSIQTARGDEWSARTL